jgi:hypothetical protein
VNPPNKIENRKIVFIEAKVLLRFSTKLNLRRNMAKYKIGSGDPTITPDAGAGKWDSESTTWEMRLKKAAVINILPHAYLIIGDDATKHMAHYLKNSGKDYTIDLEDMLDDVPNEKMLYESELAEAKIFVETLPVGTHNITSDRASGGYVKQSENTNWYFATGGYSAWGKGVATVTADATGKKGYELDFEYKFFDRYNWDGGKSVTIFGIKVTDAFMGRFHREGIAQEFNMNGSVKKNVNWGGGAKAAGSGSSGGRRN